MPSDDRQRDFDNALARHLRVGDLRNACSDAETLAAYHERALDPLQTASLTAHLSDCQRCQQVLANIQSTEEIPAPATTSPSQPGAIAASTIRPFPVRRPALWRWVAPAGALAAALLLWIAVRENNSLRIPPQLPKVEVAPAETAKAQPAPPPPAPSPSLDATRSRQSASSGHISALNASPRAQIALPPASRPSLLKQKDSASAAKKSPALDDSNSFALDSTNSVNAPSSEQDLKSVSPGAVAQTVIVQAAPPQVANDKLPNSEAKEKTANKRDASSPPSPQPKPPAGVAGGAPAAAPQQSTERVQSMSETVEVSGAVIQQQQMEGMSRFDQKSELRLANALALVTISAPNGRASWRVGSAGVIQFSADAGKTWTLQPSGVVANLLAGSAPSDKVCWIVGSAGTVLRTTDAGKHWQKTSAPTQDDFHSVFAVNARSATVSLTNASYQTTDAGATWKKLPPE